MMGLKYVIQGRSRWGLLELGGLTPRFYCSLHEQKKCAEHAGSRGSIRVAEGGMEMGEKGVVS